MDNVIRVLQEIKNTSSTNQKISILLNNKDNPLLLEVLRFVFDSFVITGLSSKKMGKEVPVGGEKIENISELFNYLNTNNTGTDRDIATVQQFIGNLPENQRSWVYEIVTKSLSIGINAKSINKAIPSLIDTFNVMLAEKYFDNICSFGGSPFFATLKLDGIRCVLIKEGCRLKLFTRQGKMLEGLKEIEQEAVSLPDGVYDGELLACAPPTESSKEVYKRTTKLVRKKGLKKGVEFHVFDVVTLEGFKKGEDPTPYRKRREKLDRLPNMLFIKPVEVIFQGSFGKDDHHILIQLDKVVEEGKEGLMLNLSEAPYVCKRSKNLLKVKKFQTADVLVKELLEGEGSNKGRLGSVTVEFEHNGKKYLSNCGTGFTEYERNLFWKTPSLIKDKFVEIQYFEVTKNSSGNYGLRFPAFVRLRPDKSEISMY